MWRLILIQTIVIVIFIYMIMLMGISYITFLRIGIVFLALAVCGWATLVA